MLPPGLAGDSFEQKLSSIDLRQQHLLRWLTSLQAYAENNRLDRDYPGFQYFTFGFIPLGKETSNPTIKTVVGGYTFGIALELEGSKVDPSQEIVSIRHAERTFPLVVNRRSATLHVPDPTSPPGTGACWAISHKPAIKPASEGVLTAEHVVSGRPLGSSVSMSGHGSWYLGDRGSCKLDAALIVQAGSVPSGLTTLHVHATPTPPVSVSFLGSATGRVIPARITHAMIHSTYLNHANPMRVFLDAHGIGGDSGALVYETASGLGVGIYMGVAPVPGTSGEGIAQALSQAKHSLRLDLFK